MGEIHLARAWLTAGDGVQRLCERTAYPGGERQDQPRGPASSTIIGPLHEVISMLSSKPASAARKILVVEGDAAPDPAKAVLVNAK